MAVKSKTRKTHDDLSFLELVRNSQKGKKKGKVITFGEVMETEIVQNGNRVEFAEELKLAWGGAETNVGFALAAMGITVLAITSFVKDSIGRGLLRRMERPSFGFNVDVKWVESDKIGTICNPRHRVWVGSGGNVGESTQARKNSPFASLKKNAIDWSEYFSGGDVALFVVGGIAAAQNPELVLVAVKAAKKHGVAVAYDLNYRSALWEARAKEAGAGGKQIETQAKALAKKVNRELVKYVDFLFGNEEDFTVALGFNVEGMDEDCSKLDTSNFRKMITAVVQQYQHLELVGTTLREATDATFNNIGAIIWVGGEFYEAFPDQELITVYIDNRIGMGDSFMSAVLYALLMGFEWQDAVNFGLGHYSLAGNFPCDTTQITSADDIFREVKRLSGSAVRFAR